MEPSHQPSPSEQRMLAVARLKRAASLPRMKDGRRPPMHPEAMSEGEKALTDEEQRDDADTPPPQQANMEECEEREEPDAVEPNVEAEVEERVEERAESEQRPISPVTQTRAKRRSRSRSRSRGSKDFKGKARAAQTPTPVSMMAGDSSQDDSPIPPPAIPLPFVFSPIPHLAALQASHLLRSQTPTVPEPYMFYPSTTPPTPMLPSLEAIQRGLFRSNSANGAAASRMLTLQKLIGADASELSPPFTPPPISGRLGRNNTVSGGERTAARQFMLTLLNGRIAEAEQASNGDAPKSTSAQKPKWQRPRRGSTTANGGAYDSDIPSTTPNTPSPPTPSLPTINNMIDIRSLSTTPNPAEGAQYMNGQLEPLPIHDNEDDDIDRLDPPRRRSLIIEDDDDEQQTRLSDLPVTPQRNATPTRIPHSSDAPSTTSLDSESAVGVPIFLSHRAPSRNEPFPSSPFTTPLKEKTDEDEQVLYHADTYRTRTPYPEAQLEREISWIADPVQEYRIPVHDEEEEDQEQEDDNEVPDEDADTPSARSSQHSSPQEAYDNASPRDSAMSNNILIETENFSDTPPSQAPPSPTFFAAPEQHPSTPRPSNDSAPPASFPDSSHNQAEHLPHDGGSTDLDTTSGEMSKQRNGESSSPSAWEKMKITFMKSTSSSGRRSRSNSIINRDKREQIDASIHRESGNSLTMLKLDSTMQTHQLLMQSPSASASISSLAPYTPTRAAPSPIPPATHRYQNAKLFPFPGIHMLEEQRRAKGFPIASASVPDIANFYYSSNEDGQSQSFAASPTRTPELIRERKLSHQASDTRLLEHLNASKPASNSSGHKLPMSLPAVRQWLTKNKNGKKNASSATTPNSESKSTNNRKPLLADLLRRKESELGTDWEDISTPTSTSGDTLPGRLVSKSNSKDSERAQISVNGGTRTEHTDTERTPKAKKVMPSLEFGPDLEPYPHLCTPTSFSTGDPQLSATPDPMSSTSDYAALTSESSSRTSSRYSIGAGHGAQLLQRLEDSLVRNSRASLLSSVDDPPRKLILSSPVLQVVNSNTVKDRLLFLFSDVLVIAKPVSQEQDALRTSSDKRCLVKNVVMLRDLRLGIDRGEFQTKVSYNSLMPRSSVVKTFVNQFARDPDQAIAMLFSKSGTRDDPALLGQLLFRAVELDRTKLGEYLSRRSSRSTLKAYLDCFGFAGLRLDQALRAFLLSVHIPSKLVSAYSPLEYLLDHFSSRWYDANATFVAYDKDLAYRLVRALVQLNDLLHGGVAQEPGSSTVLKQDIPSQLFVDAFRKADPRYLVSDEHLEDLYHSIRLERLSQARCSSTISSADQIITIKRSLPMRLTYKLQSEPIILRIPQPDPQLTIQLYGQDLVFDPPTLTFSKSSEASFRVTGTSLGMKTMIMCRSGPNALRYSGLPLSNSLVVERAFMRNTFQVAFLNHLGLKRRYMFSVDDPVVRHQWTVSLRTQVDSALAAAVSPPASLPMSALDFFKASQHIAFRVLQETLTGVSTNPTHKYKDKVNGLPFITVNGKNMRSELHSENGVARLATIHTRSKSRSKVYHKYGAGRNELDLNSDSQNSYSYQGGETDSFENTDQEVQDEAGAHEGPTWSARELELQCQQNSILATVSALLLFAGQESGAHQAS
ncbi:hypothetical protein AX17_004616 [Amanita inopinata Kibby_2008]|nr:hypothetical protein AX17_004616 [Amanita inopinata Kibby_2008]